MLENNKKNMEKFDFNLKNINIMESVKTVKSLLFKVKMDGIGTVNFDGSDAVGMSKAMAILQQRHRITTTTSKLPRANTGR